MARERVDERGLAAAVGADERHVLAALEPQVDVLHQRPARDRHLAALHLEDHAPAALGRLESEAELLAVTRVALDPLRSLELLGPRLRLARARAGAKAVHEP